MPHGDELRDSEQSDPTRQDLKQLAFAVLLFELVILGLALAARGFLGSRAALWVGLGLGALVLAAFALITTVIWLVHSIADHLWRRRHRPTPPSQPCRLTRCCTRRRAGFIYLFA